MTSAASLFSPVADAVDNAGITGAAGATVAAEDADGEMIVSVSCMATDLVGDAENTGVSIDGVALVGITTSAPDRGSTPAAGAASAAPVSWASESEPTASQRF